MLRSLEGIGAEVESDRPGEAFFAIDGLRSLWGARREDVLARAARAIHEAGGAARVAGAATRFCAFAAASTAPAHRHGRSRAPRVVRNGGESDFLAPLPVALLDGRLRAERGDAGGRLVVTLERLGVSRKVEVDPGKIVQAILAGGTWKAPHPKNFTIRTARVNGARRIEIADVEPGRIAGLKAMGCFTEIIAYKTRVFVPMEKAEAVLAAVVG